MTGSLSQENNPRTFKEVLAMVPEASKKDVTKCYTFIVKGLDDVVRTSSPSQPCRMMQCHPHALLIRTRNNPARALMAQSDTLP